ncbi:MAG: hypothetical protein Q6366_013320 [Candidatus Freyarchaeota archaeon]
MDSKWLKISLVAILIAGAIFVYYAYTTASTIDMLKTLKAVTSKWNPFNDIIGQIVGTIINILKKAFGVV